MNKSEKLSLVEQLRDSVRHLPIRDQLEVINSAKVAVETQKAIGDSVLLALGRALEFTPKDLEERFAVSFGGTDDG